MELVRAINLVLKICLAAPNVNLYVVVVAQGAAAHMSAESTKLIGQILFWFK